MVLEVDIGGDALDITLESGHVEVSVEDNMVTLYQHGMKIGSMSMEYVDSLDIMECDEDGE